MKVETKRKLIKKLDRIFSKYIRLRESVDGYVKCYTCGAVMRWQDATVGHFIKRQFLGVRFDERNVKIQCRRCNYFLQGNDSVFAEKLKEEYGENILDVLELEKNKRLSSGDLNVLIEYYKIKLKEIVK